MPNPMSPSSPSTVNGTLFHSPVSNPHGDQLLPINLMRERYPELHKRHYAKYVGRQPVLDQAVPPLACTWGDVVFFSPVDSTLLFDAIRESGRTMPGQQFWTIDAGALDPRRTCIRLMRKSATAADAEPATADDFLPYTTATLRAVSRVTVAAVERLRNLRPDEPLLPWVDVPHVLHRGPVPISLLHPPAA